MQIILIYLSLLIIGGYTTPLKDELMFEGPGDTAIVESTVREARAAPKDISDLLKPGVKDAFLHVYGDAEDDDGDLHGYSKRMNDKGRDGYRHFDGFHKKDGNKYGYEKHAEYGQEKKAKVDSENDKGFKASLAAAGYDGGKDEDDGEESKKYAVLSEADSDDRKHPKKKVESGYDFFDGEGEGGGDGGGSYYGGEDYYGDDKKDDKAESNGSAEGSAEGDDGEAETEETKESGEENEESSEY